MNLKTSPKAILFDLDGTLIDSKVTIARHFVGALDELQVPHQLSVRQVSHSLDQSFEDLNHLLGLGMDDDQFIHFVETYRKNYYADPLKGTKIFPHVKSTLQFLKKRGYRIVLATGKQLEIAVKSLESMGLSVFFDLIQGWEPGLKPKPHPDILERAVSKLGLDQTRCIMVGDTYIDILAGQALGMPTVAALYGFGIPENLMTYKPSFSMNKFNELKGIIQNLEGEAKWAN